MAWRMKLRLPSFKLTQRCTRGDTAQYNIPRGRKDVKNEAMNDEEMGSEAGPSWESPLSATPLPDLGDFEAEQGSTPTLHEVKQAANVTAWENIRSRLLQAATECNAMPVDACCIICSSTAKYRCIHCGPLAYYCLSCLGHSHSKANVFHGPEVWDVSHTNEGRSPYLCS